MYFNSSVPCPGPLRLKLLVMAGLYSERMCQEHNKRYKYLWWYAGRKDVAFVLLFYHITFCIYFVFKVVKNKVGEKISLGSLSDNTIVEQVLVGLAQTINREMNFSGIRRLKQRRKQGERTTCIWHLINTKHKHGFHTRNVNRTRYQKRPYYRGISYLIFFNVEKKAKLFL